MSMYTWVCAGLGETEGNLAGYTLNCYMGYLRRRDAEVRGRRERAKQKGSKKKSTFRKVCIGSDDFCIYIELCILVGICIKKCILREF